MGWSTAPELRFVVGVVGNKVDSFDGFANMMVSAKRKRALLESNPLRNNRREVMAWPDGRLKGFPVRLFFRSHAIDSLMP